MKHIKQHVCFFIRVYIFINNIYSFCLRLFNDKINKQIYKKKKKIKKTKRKKKNKNNTKEDKKNISRKHWRESSSY